MEESGTFYLDVSSDFLPGVNYTLTASVVEDDFAGDTSTTGVLDVGGFANGTFDFEFDSDWFAIELTAGETTIISFDNFDADFVLRDASGAVVAFGELGFSAIDQTITADVAAERDILCRRN